MSLKISIITPSYNQGHFIRQTIESVLNQNYKNFEHIIIDGGSTDNTIDVLKEYNHLNWISEKDSGAANAINKGFKLAKGDIFCWLNSDDYYEKNIFGYIADFFSNESGNNLLIGNLTVVNEDNEVVLIDKTYHYDMDYLVKINADVIRQPCSFFSSRLYEKAGGLDESLKLVFDYDLFIRMLKYAKPVFADKNFAYYREHSNTLTQSNIRKQALEIKKVSQKYGGKIIDPIYKSIIKKILVPHKFSFGRRQ